MAKVDFSAGDLPAPMPTSVQILSTVLFAAFAIPVTIVALNIFWPAGIALAIILGWRGGFAPGLAQRPLGADIRAAVQDLNPGTTVKTSGNTSFDAYRADTLNRLEEEQNRFDAFLERLREARDKVEFDQFMDDRAQARLPRDNAAA